MIKYLLLILSVVVFACGGPSGIVISDEDKATFERNYKAFEKHHIGGVVAEDLDLFLDLYSDTLKWSGPNVYDGSFQTKSDLAAAAKGYIDQFENFSFVSGGVNPDNDGGYWGGNLYADNGEINTAPNGIRIYGIWNATHSETGAPVQLKFYAIQQFNEAGKVVLLNEWFDPSSMENQIKAFVESK